MKAKETKPSRISNKKISGRSRRNLSSFEACEFLYLTHKVKVSNNDNALRSDSIKRTKFTLTKSDEIYKKSKLRSFTKIFKILDKTNSGRISVKNFECSSYLMIGLPKNIQNIFLKIYPEINENEYTLNFEEFLVASNNLFHLLSLEEKDILIKFAVDSKKHITIETNNFQVF